MNTVRLLLIGTTLYLILGSSSAAATNILVNAGFETGALSPWVIGNGSPVVTTDEAHTGIYSVAAFGPDQIRQTFSPVSTTAVSEVSLWVKRAGGPFDSYSFLYEDGLSETFFLEGTGDNWGFFNLTSNLNLTKSLIGFQIFGTTSGPAYLDDFTIDVASSVPVSATLGLLMIGLASIGYQRRKLIEAP